MESLWHLFTIVKTKIHNYYSISSIVEKMKQESDALNKSLLGCEDEVCSLKVEYGKCKEENDGYTIINELKKDYLTWVINGDGKFIIANTLFKDAIMGTAEEQKLTQAKNDGDMIVVDITLYGSVYKYEIIRVEKKSTSGCVLSCGIAIPVKE